MAICVGGLACIALYGQTNVLLHLPFKGLTEEFMDKKGDVLQRLK